MKIRVLGSAAGGGFPQWNCHCRNCAGLRQGTVRAQARSQSSIAIAGSGESSWALVNASPDIRAQLEANPVLQRGREVRDSAIAAIILVDGQIDHTTGLYMLRESPRPWPLWCTDAAYADLTRGNPVLGVLSHYCGVDRHRIGLDGEEFLIDGVANVRWRALPVAGKPAPYSPNRLSSIPGDNIALVVTDEVSGQSALYAPGLGAVDERLWRSMMNLVIFPVFFLSGSLYPVHQLPLPLQIVASLNPYTYGVDLLRHASIAGPAAASAADFAMGRDLIVVIGFSAAALIVAGLRLSRDAVSEPLVHRLAQNR